MISEPTKSLLDVLRGLASLVEQDTGPNTEGMGRVPLQLFLAHIWPYFADGGSNKLCNLVSCEIEDLASFLFIHSNGQITRLTQTLRSHGNAQCAENRANLWMIDVRSKRK